MTHTVTSATGAWTPFNVLAAKSISKTFSVAGSYPYSDNLTGATGMITVNTNVWPTVTITDPVDGATYAWSNIITIAALASDPDGSIASVQFLRWSPGYGTNSIGTVTAPPYSLTVTNPYLFAAESNIIFAVATDNSGGRQTNSVMFNLHFSPTVSFESPKNLVAPFSTFDLTARGYASGASVAGLELIFNGSSLGIVATNYFSVTLSNLSSGIYPAQAIITDDVGWRRTNSMNVAVTFAPSLSVLSPAPGTVFDPADSMTINATASDADGTIARVEFWRDYLLLGQVTAPPYTFTVTNVGSIFGPAGGVTGFSVVAVDNLGIATTNNVSIVTDTQPYVKVTSPANGSTYLNSASFTISADATNFNVQQISVEFFVDQTSIGVDTTWYSPPFSANAANVGPGLHTISAVATDQYGRKATNSVAISVVTLPAVPTGVTAEAAISSTVLISWVDNASNEDGYFVDIWGAAPFIGYKQLSSNATSCTFTGLQEMTTYFMDVRAVNAAGTVTSAVVSVTTPAPVHLVRVPPFTGNTIETFEEFSGTNISQQKNVPLPIFGGAATISATSATVWSNGIFGLGDYTAKAFDGTHGYNTGGYPTTGQIKFVNPVKTFGGYWGCGYQSIYLMSFTFYDSSGKQFDQSNVPFTSPGNDGSLQWWGWQSDVPISRVDFSGAWPVCDSLRYSPLMQLVGEGIFGPAQFSFQATGDPGNYVIEFSTNLVDWASVTNLTITTNSVGFSDNVPSNSPVRFYRMRTGP